MKSIGKRILATALAMLLAVAFWPAVAQATGPVCQIGTTGYPSLDAALAAANDGETIKLLADIDYTQSLVIDGIKVQLDLNGYTLHVDVDMTGQQSSCDGVLVTNGGWLWLIHNDDGSANGEFIVSWAADSNPGQEFAAVEALFGGLVEVTDIEASGTSAVGIRSDGDVSAGGSAEAFGDVSVIGDYSIGAEAGHNSATNVHGDILIQGEGCEGARAIDANQLEVTGNVTVQGPAGTGVRSAGSELTVLGDVTVQGTNGIGANVDPYSILVEGVEQRCPGLIIIEGTVTAEQYVLVEGAFKSKADINPTLSSPYDIYTAAATDDAQNTTMVAIRQKYKVTFMSDGAVFATKTARAGLPLGIGTNWPTNPTKTGYSFGGWYTGQNGTGTAFTAKTVVTAPITVYAKWTALSKYTVTATVNNTSYGSVAGAGTFYSGTVVSLKAIPKAGCRFVRWVEGSTAVSTSAEYGFTLTRARTLKAEFAAIAAPVITAASAGYNGIKVSWAAVAGAKEYEIYRATSLRGTYTRVGTTAALSYTNTGLTTGTAYYYKVRAKCAAGSTTTYGGYSAIVSAKPVPATPTGARAASASYSSIKLTWGAVAGASGYEIWRATAKAGAYTRVAAVAGTVAAWTNAGLTTGKTYYYKVRAYRKVVNITVYGGWSAIIWAKPVPAVPTGITAARASSTSIRLAWSAVAGATKYEIWRATSKDGTYAVIAETASTSYTNAKLAADAVYYYKVRAYRLVGATRVYGGYSAVVWPKP